MRACRLHAHCKERERESKREKGGGGCGGGERERERELIRNHSIMGGRAEARSYQGCCA
jgi:hypothetical protein